MQYEIVEINELKIKGGISHSETNKALKIKPLFNFFFRNVARSKDAKEIKSRNYQDSVSV